VNPDWDAGSSPDDNGLARLVRRIEIGGLAAGLDIHVALAAGTEFLLRRRLGKADVSAEVKAVLDVTIGATETTCSLQPVTLAGLLVYAIHHLFPSSVRTTVRVQADPQADETAKSVISDMSAVEQQIIRRYYLLEHPQEKIERSLQVSSSTITRTLNRARAMFFDRAKRSEL